MSGTCRHTVASMSTFERDGVTLDHCRKCGAVWCDAGELEHLRQLKGIAEGTATIQPDPESPRESCPSCEQETLIRGLAPRSHLQVCTSCRGTLLPAAVFPAQKEGVGWSESFGASVLETVTSILLGGW